MSSIQSTAGHEESRGKPGGPPSKPKYYSVTDSVIPLGKGEIDIKDKINFAVKNNCTCVLETKTVEGLRESVQYLTNYIIN